MESNQIRQLKVGYNAHSKDGNIAIGAYSDATTDLSTDTSDKAKAYLTNDTAASYVSVGSSDVKRRIMNVADGAADSDVATIGQLKKLSDKAGVYNEGWGIKIGEYTKKDANGNETTVKNAISVDRNLGSNEITTKSKNTFKAAGENSLILGGAGTDNLVSIDGNPRETQFGAYGKDSVLVGGENNKITDTGTYAVISGGGQNIVSGQHSFIGGGWWNTASGATSTVLGGQSNTASGNQSTIVGGDSNRAIGNESSILGGNGHTAVGESSTISGGVGAYTLGSYSSVSGGQGNVAIGMTSSADGGWLNFAYGDTSQVGGGYSNYALGNYSNSLGGRNGVVQGNVSVGIAGGSTGAGAGYALAAGYQSVVTGDGVRREKSDDVYDAIMEAGKDAQGNEGYKYTDVATALGYQATADAPGTISFGHDKGDVSGYTVNWDYEFETDTQGNIKFDENGMPLVKSMKPNSITTNYYDTAKYNRLVKAADGIEDHDAVVMEQLKNASDVGSKIKVYQTDENGNIKFDKNNNPIEDTSDSDAVKTKREAAQKASEDAWGEAIGTGHVADPKASNAKDNGSGQLVTGGKVYTEVRPATDGTYVKTKNTTAANLTALDKQVAANTTKLGDKNHNIKYYSVEDKISDDKLLPSISGYSNEKNDGAKGAGSMAAGFNTHADGIASTVAGSYSGVINSKTNGLDLRGATALSYGTFNVNQNAAQAGTFSGVANSIVGQANVTTDSNAAIIYGAGNTVKNSYREIDTKNASEIMAAAGSRDVTKLSEALQKAVPTSGGQVMVMGGGNSVDKAYMTQVTGVGNTVTGSGEKYDKDSSTQLNYVDGFYTTLTNGKNDYLIGAHNTVTGDSTDKNQSNIVFGDNHKLTNTKNNIILGSAGNGDTTTVSDVVSIGHNAKVSAEGGVAIGSGSEATVEGKKIAGYDPATGTNSTNTASATWQATNGAVSVGKADGSVTRQINGVAAGTNETDAVNVAQLKKLGDNTVQYDLNTGKGKITLAGNGGTTITNVKSALAGVKDADNKDATIATATGDALKNAVNLGDLQNVYNEVNSKAEKANTSHTALTVEGGKAAGTEDGSYTGNNILLHATTDKETGKVTYDLKLNNDIMIGNKGKDGVSITGPQGEAGKDGIDGKVGISGKDGKDAVSITGKDGVGHIGLTGPKGADGTPGASIDISVKDGYNKAGKDGKDGINGEKGVDGNNLTRVVYTDKTGEHQIATMEDGLKFKGDDETVISKKLNNTLEIIGGADSKKLTEGNIGVNSTEDGKLKVQLAQDLTKITSISNQTTTGEGEQAKTTGAKIDLGEDGNISVNNGKITDVGDGSISHSSKDAINGETLYNEVRPTKGKYVSAGKTTAQNLTSLDEQIQSNEAQITNMDNRSVKYDMSADNQSVDKTKITLAGNGGTTITNVKSALAGVKDADNKDATIATATGDALKNAVNLGDLQKVYNDVNAKADKASASHTALTVEGGTSAGTKDEKTKEDVYAGKNILLHESTDENGKVTYDLKLAKDINIGKPGKDGEDGKIGIDGKDGHIGLNGSDGITVRGLDGKDGTPGKDGVTITGPKGEAGKDGIDGKVGISGKDGNDAVSISGKDGVGHIGLTGPAGTNGMNGADGKPGTSIDITVKNGYDGKTGTDGKDGVKGENGVDGTSLTRIVYTDKTGEHQVATMEDGLKFKGDDDTVIAKKLNNTMEIIGGADSKNLTEGNIGVNSTDKGQLKVQLAKDLTGITSISNQKTEGDKTTGAKITLGTDGSIDVHDGKITHVGSALDGAKDAEGKDATIATATGDALKNAANLGDLQKVYNDVNAKADKASASHTALTVEGGTSAGTKDEKTKEDVYAGKNILLHESTDENGKVTYDLKLAKDINIGKPGKDGEDGKIGIDGKDGHIGLNGSDGITVRGLDGKDGTPGKDGVTITGPKGEAGKDGIDGKVGISGKDGNDAVSISGKDGVGHIGLTGPAGTNGKDGASIDITVKNGYDKNGVNGAKGVDGKDGITRIVYTDKTGEHQVATMEDGLKFKGDDTTVIAKKLNNTLDIIGGADSKNLTEGNIGVNSTDKGQLKVQLAKDLKGITSISNQNTTKVDGKDVTTGAKIDLGEDGNISVNGGKITNVGSGIEKGTDDKYTVTDANKTNAANIGDVDNMVKQAVDGLSNTTDTKLADKANVNASNVGANISGSDEQKKANEEAWGDALGKGEIQANEKRLVTGDTVNTAINAEKGAREAADQAINNKIGTLDETKKYNYIDASKSISYNLDTLDTKVKKNADDITKINNSISSLDQNAVKYDNSSKSKVTLGGGEDGTTITNVKAGSVAKDSKEAVNGGQLYEVNEKVTNNTNEITKIKNGDFTDTSKTVIKNLAKDAVQVKAGDRIKVAEATDEKTGNKTYTISANNDGKVEKNNGNLISGDTLYNEVRPTEDGSYVKKDKTTHENLSALDKGLKTTSDLIHTNDKGDTIQIGGNSTATKIDVSGKDANGNTTGRVITGVISDASNPNSAANVGYVNSVMNNTYGRLDRNINRAAAGSNALAALHPLDYDPADKASFAVGYGHYHNANAAAVGAFYQPNANTMVNMGISLGNGDPGFNAGVSFKIGKGSIYNGVSKAEMAQTIHDQAEEIKTIKANDATKDKRIDALEKENQEMKKQIQEILARLNG